ncbi:MAG: UbiA family prenyltransferase [Acidobacteria bacterium]|nr:UbiA family prenyltransferase [Acidobacteriota bacterium]
MSSPARDFRILYRGRWLRLIKFRYHVTFVSVLCGALLFAPPIERQLGIRLVLLYCCFNVLLYGGIYTLNDIADRASDARHPRKGRRPVASGAVSVRAAAIYGLVLVASGLGLGSLLFKGVASRASGPRLGSMPCVFSGSPNRQSRTDGRSSGRRTRNVWLGSTGSGQNDRPRRRSTDVGSPVLAPPPSGTNGRRGRHTRRIQRAKSRDARGARTDRTGSEPSS